MSSNAQYVDRCQQPQGLSTTPKEVIEIELPQSSSTTIEPSSNSAETLIFEKSSDSHIKHPQHNRIERTTTTTSQGEPLYSVFTKHQKLFIVFIASWAAFFSPVSNTIYLPALNALALHLRVSDTLINLTLTSYMIFQGLAPSFMGNLADVTGRRPAYLVCFIIYIGANIGLALQDSYAALFVLRCLQSTGSSATIAMASAVVSDISVPSERGKYMGFTLAGSLLGPAIGPVIGGVLTQFLGWRAIFWFLAIFAGAFLAVFALFFPETARRIVGNGSIPPRGLNMSLMNYLAVRNSRKAAPADPDSHDVETTHPQRFRTRFPNPLSSLKIVLHKSNALLLFYNAFLFAAFYDVTATIPSQFEAIYKYNDFQIGLCYIPLGMGSLVAALLNGQLLDRHFQRCCKKLGISIKKGRDQDLSNFPIEKVRLQIALPAVYITTAFLLIFGWVLQFHGPVPVLLVVMFFLTLFMTIAFNVTSTLLVDFYPTKAATATAANNLVRCLIGAGATGLIVPMINGMGIGWTYTLLSLFLIATSPMLWLLVWKGMAWRRVRIDRQSEKKRDKRNKSAAAAEEGTVDHNKTADKHAQSQRQIADGDGTSVEVLSTTTEHHKT